MKAMFEENPTLAMAQHLSAASRGIMYRTGFITSDQALSTRELFESTADLVEHHLPELLRPDLPLPEKFSLHLRRRVAQIDQQLSRAEAAV